MVCLNTAIVLVASAHARNSGRKGDYYGDQTMTSSHKKTELNSQETTGQKDRKEGRKKGRFEEEDEQVEAASSGGI